MALKSQILLEVVVETCLNSKMIVDGLSQSHNMWIKTLS